MVITKYYPDSGSGSQNGIKDETTDSDISDFIPKGIDSNLYNEETLLGALPQSTLEAFTNSERKRASGKCFRTACPLNRHQYYTDIFEDVFEAQVGIPFVPKFEVFLGNG